MASISDFNRSSQSSAKREPLRSILDRAIDQRDKAESQCHLAIDTIQDRVLKALKEHDLRGAILGGELWIRVSDENSRSGERIEMLFLDHIASLDD